MTTRTAQSIQSTLVRDFTAESAKTRALLAAVPEAQLAWKPHEKSMSLGQLVGHLAETPTWLHAIVEGDEMDFEGMEESYQPFVPSSATELMQTFEKNVEQFLATMAEQEDAFLEQEWTMRKGAKVLMQQPREEVVRSIMLHHVAHHRGQLTVYLRLLGVPVPATYGSTADVQMF